jgi:hypothetical protein
VSSIGISYCTVTACLVTWAPDLPCFLSTSAFLSPSGLPFTPGSQTGLLWLISKNLLNIEQLSVDIGA